MTTASLQLQTGSKDQADLWAQELSGLICLRLSFLLEALDPIRLPDYPGSALRGVFGRALRRTACMVHSVRCEDCILKNSCIYSHVFETPVPQDSAMLRRYPKAPHPFVLAPESIPGGIIQPGETFSFGMTLMGHRAVDAFPYFVAAVMRMGEMGVGAGYGSFVIRDVRVLDADGCRRESLWDGKDLERPETILGLEALQHYAARLPHERMKIRFITPFRFRYQENLCDRPEFHILVRTLLRRISSLYYFHMGRHPDLPYADLIRLAEDVRISECDMKWHDWQRWSTRQKRPIPMGGIVGSATYEGELAPFLLPLALGTWVHVGKGTSMGLGKIEAA
ncbi:MAG: CRISPR system precrRNA processing endoribonuclease RAMP protein Cas6 [Deltaproteobacteria bacterium]